MSTKRLRCTVDDSRATAVLEGDIDEFANLSSLTDAMTGPALRFDLAGVRRINSLGLRNWIRWLQMLADRKVEFVRCSPTIVEQLSAIKDFRGHAVVTSVLLPYVCERCEARYQPEIEVRQLRGARELPQAPMCKNCRTPCTLDDFPERYINLARY